MLATANPADRNRSRTGTVPISATVRLVSQVGLGVVRVVAGHDRQAGLGDLTAVRDHGALVGTVGVWDSSITAGQSASAACSAQRRASVAPYTATPGMTAKPSGAAA